MFDDFSRLPVRGDLAWSADLVFLECSTKIPAFRHFPDGFSYYFSFGSDFSSCDRVSFNFNAPDPLPHELSRVSFFTFSVQTLPPVGAIRRPRGRKQAPGILSLMGTPGTRMAFRRLQVITFSSFFIGIVEGMGVLRPSDD